MSNIEGAINPQAMKPHLSPVASGPTSPEADVGTFTSMGEGFDSKRSPFSLNMFFKDGEHSGEASLAEIIAGLDDGELSQNCHVFDADIDEWVVISSLLERLGTSTNSEATTEESSGAEVSSSEDEGDNEVSGENQEDVVDERVQYGNEDDEAVSVLYKNDKKKPARDSSNWGKGSVQPIDATEVQGWVSSLGIENETRFRTKKVGHVQPTPKLMRTVTQAVVQWDMLQDGDRLLLGLSGGKDSLSLLHILLEFQRKLPIRFDIEASFVLEVATRFSSNMMLTFK